jgi:hypothetical protein
MRIRSLSVIPAVCAIFACSSSSGSLHCAVNTGGTQDCYAFSGLSSDELSTEQTVCTSEMGALVDSCPTGYVGACTTNIGGFVTEQYYYFGTASELAGACTSELGTWMAGTGGGDGGGFPDAAGGGTTSLFCHGGSGPTETCVGYVDVSSAQKSALDMTCSEEGAKIVAACPPGYVGICSMNDGDFTTNQYVYGATASEGESSCVGTWMAAPKAG